MTVEYPTIEESAEFEVNETASGKYKGRGDGLSCPTKTNIDDIWDWLKARTDHPLMKLGRARYSHQFDVADQILLPEDTYNIGIVSDALARIQHADGVAKNTIEESAGKYNYHLDLKNLQIGLGSLTPYGVYIYYTEAATATGPYKYMNRIHNVGTGGGPSGADKGGQYYRTTTGENVISIYEHLKSYGNGTDEIVFHRMFDCEYSHIFAENIIIYGAHTSQWLGGYCGGAINPNFLLENSDNFIMKGYRVDNPAGDGLVVKDCQGVRVECDINNLTQSVADDTFSALKVEGTSIDNYFKIRTGFGGARKDPASAQWKYLVQEDGVNVLDNEYDVNSFRKGAKTAEFYLREAGKARWYGSRRRSDGSLRVEYY